MQTGTQLGHYTILSIIGKGGMGVVWKARDTKLDREVAVKALPEEFSLDLNRLTRLDREAKLLASLNHPNIAAIYGIEDFGQTRFLVLELVDGETLEERLQHGALSVQESLRIARQIVEALDAAHEKGIIHRDLKPANIKVTRSGQVKILDFGLAKALATDESSLNFSHLPTQSLQVTMHENILGTPAYMSPEQARGEQLDKRADIWAFGCVLYEMVSGSRAFTGASVTEILGAILHKEPTWERVPPAVAPLLRRCLEKDPKRRLRDIGDAIGWIEPMPSVVGPSQPQPQSRPWLAWSISGCLLLATIALSFLYFREAVRSVESDRYQVFAPDKSTLGTYVSVSPNGRHVAFNARGEDGITRIWIRDRSTLDSRVLTGSEGGTSPFWSPDSAFIAFGVGNELKTVAVSGGPAKMLCRSHAAVGSGSWGEGGVILFGSRSAGGGLLQVSSDGGVPMAATTIDPTRGEAFHAFPSFLPDGRHFTYFVSATVPDHLGTYLGSLDDNPEGQNRSRLVESPFGAIFAATEDPSAGRLLFLSDSTLMAQLFDLRNLRLMEEPVPVAERVTTINQYGVFSASRNGVLAYRSNNQSLTATWLDRNGKNLGTVSPGLPLAQNPRLSHDERKLALVQGADLWSYNLDGQPPIKLTFGDNPRFPLWSIDSRSLLYELSHLPVGARDGTDAASPDRPIVSIPADSAKTTADPASPPGHFHPHGWTSSGELVAVHITGGATRSDIVRFLPGPKSHLTPIVQTPANEGLRGAAVSPDGRWLAYTSDTTGTFEIWVQSLLQPSASPIRVSLNGGDEPVWAKNGLELFYLEGPRMMSVAVDIRSGFKFKRAERLFESQLVRSSLPPSYDVARNGHFMVLRSSDTSSNPINVVTNWHGSLAVR